MVVSLIVWLPVWCACNINVEYFIMQYVFEFQSVRRMTLPGVRALYPTSIGWAESGFTSLACIPQTRRNRYTFAPRSQRGRTTGRAATVGWQFTIARALHSVVVIAPTTDPDSSPPKTIEHLNNVFMRRTAYFTVSVIDFHFSCEA